MDNLRNISRKDAVLIHLDMIIFNGDDIIKQVEICKSEWCFANISNILKQAHYLIENKIGMVSENICNAVTIEEERDVLMDFAYYIESCVLNLDNIQTKSTYAGNVFYNTLLESIFKNTLNCVNRDLENLYDIKIIDEDLSLNFDPNKHGLWQVYNKQSNAVKKYSKTIHCGYKSEEKILRKQIGVLKNAFCPKKVNDRMIER